MNGLRYHGLALGASVVTLALGVVLGVGPITDHQDASSTRREAAAKARQTLVEQQLAAATAQGAGDHALATALAAPLAHKQLSGHSVLLVAAPGADRTTLRRTSTAVRRAGGTVTGTLTLRAEYVDPTKAQSPLEDLVLRLVPPEVTFADGATPIDRVGTVLARSTVTRDASAAGGIDQKAAELIAGLDSLRALSLDGDPGRLADLAIVVAGRAPRGADARAGSRAALVGLVHALAAGSRGTVVVGAATPAGLVGRVRAAPGGAPTDAPDAAGTAKAAVASTVASTVDTAGSVAGELATVLALAEQLSGGHGDYGAARGDDALVPDVAPVAARD